jgi:hypothetical protein
MYPGLHHTHQKFSLLVLVQFVLNVVIHLTGPVQRQKLRGSLGDVGMLDLRLRVFGLYFMAELQPARMAAPPSSFADSVLNSFILPAVA